MIDVSKPISNFEWHNDLNVRKLNKQIVKYAMKIYKYRDKYINIKMKHVTYNIRVAFGVVILDVVFLKQNKTEKLMT